MTEEMHIEYAVIDALKTIYDPEIPVNIYDLGLIYEVNVDNYDNVDVVMTLTAPNCPMADMLLEQVNEKVKGIKDVNRANVELVFDPPWHQDMMSEEAKLELGFL